MGTLMHDLNPPTSRSPADQADGLRRLFTAPRQRIVPLVANPMVENSGVVLERMATALAGLGANTLLVDAADTSPDAHEMADIDLAACVEPLGDKVHYLADAGQQPRGELVEGLVRQHQVEIMVGSDRKQLKHLIEDTAMLGGDADAQIDCRAFPQFGNDRRHLDGFRPRSEYRNHFLHRERYFLNDSS